GPAEPGILVLPGVLLHLGDLGGDLLVVPGGGADEGGRPLRVPVLVDGGEEAVHGDRRVLGAGAGLRVAQGQERGRPATAAQQHRRGQHDRDDEQATPALRRGLARVRRVARRGRRNRGRDRAADRR